MKASLFSLRYPSHELWLEVRAHFLLGSCCRSSRSRIVGQVPDSTIFSFLSPSYYSNLKPNLKPNLKSNLQPNLSTAAKKSPTPTKTSSYQATNTSRYRLQIQNKLPFYYNEVTKTASSGTGSNSRRCYE